MSLSSLAINGNEISKAETIPPKSNIYLNVENKSISKILSFNFINDYGVQIKNKQCVF